MRTVVVAATVVAVLIVMAGALAVAAPAEPPAAPVAVAQAAPAPAGSSVPQRVEALEKQNLVLSEDLGKAQLKARELENVTKQQAEAIATLNQQLAEEQKKAEAERQKQAKRNRQLWLGIGVVFLGVLAAN